MVQKGHSLARSVPDGVKAARTQRNQTQAIALLVQTPRRAWPYHTRAQYRAAHRPRRLLSSSIRWASTRQCIAYVSRSYAVVEKHTLCEAGTAEHRRIRRPPRSLGSVSAAPYAGSAPDMVERVTAAMAIGSGTPPSSFPPSLPPSLSPHALPRYEISGTGLPERD
eukprot:46308-Rhodomonas_salina.1